MLPHLIVFLTAAAQLDTADIAIVIDETVTRVEASYLVRGEVDSVRFVMMTIRGQAIRLDTVSPGPASMVDSGGTILLSVPSSETRRSRVLLRYEVQGTLTRVPLFIPRAPTDPATSDVLIRVEGVAPGASLSDGFPRLVRRADGAVIARPENIPSFVRVPPDGRRLSINRVSDAVVVGLLVFGSAFWLLRRYQARKAALLSR